jgi:uncharacterized membrane protein
MRPRLLVGTTLLAVAVSLAVSYAVHAYRSTRASSADPFAMLDLSATQQNKIRQILREFHPRLITMQAQVERQREQLAELLASPGGVDHSAVQERLKEISRLEAERDQEVVRGLLELKPHLTAQQQLALFQYIELRHATMAKAH